MSIDILNPHVVLSASPEVVIYLRKLFPQLSKCAPNPTVPFFHIQDVCTQSALQTLRSMGVPYVVVSNVLFDLQVDDELLKDLTLQFIQKYYRSRKRILHVPDGIDILDFLNSYIYGLTDEVVASDLLDLFEVVGSRGFAQVFCERCIGSASESLIASVITFLSKLDKPTTLYYKRASERLKRRYVSNYDRAATNYSLSYSSNLSESDKILLFIKFHDDLFLT